MAGKEAVPDAALETAKTFFEEVFPDSLIVPATVPADVAERMRKAGIGLAQVISLQDGSECFATFITQPTPHTKALERIWFDEEGGNLPAGSHDAAMDAIINGEFSAEWGAYLP